IMAVTMDENGDYVSMEQFLPNLRVVAPPDMTIAHAGAIYLLAYGTNWFAHNTDAGTIRAGYSGGNRTPVAVARPTITAGAAPLKVSFTSEGSKDFDREDRLSYQWSIGGKKIKAQNLTYTFKKPGTYPVTLTVTDDKGGAGTATLTIRVGNAPPVVHILTENNKSF